MTDSVDRPPARTDETSTGDLGDCREVSGRQNSEQRTRDRLPNRRGNVFFNFFDDGREYHATAASLGDGWIAEIFLDVGKAGSTVQQHAEATAVRASIALQHGVAPQTIIHAVSGGPLAMALDLAEKP